MKESETITLMAAAKETLERHWKGTRNEMTAWNNARDVFERMGRDVPVNEDDSLPTWKRMERSRRPSTASCPP